MDPNIRKELKLDEDTERRFSKLVAAADLLLPSGEELERAAGVEGGQTRSAVCSRSASRRSR